MFLLSNQSSYMYRADKKHKLAWKTAVMRCEIMITCKKNTYVLLAYTYFKF